MFLSTISGFIILNFMLHIFLGIFFFKRTEATPKYTAFFGVAYLFLGLYFAVCSLRGMVLESHLAIVSSWVSLFLVASAFGTHEKPLTTVFSEDVPSHFVNHGIYRWIRHPFYSGYIWNCVAYGICLESWWVWLAGFVLSVTYWFQARQEEQKFLSSPFAQAYKDYQKRSWMFFPYLL